MTRLNLFLIIAVLCCSICIATSNVHKSMTTEELQSIFHVDNTDSIPSYEIVRLTHHGTATAHSVKKRSVASNTETTNHINEPPHHVKKDLSKSPYFSELKLAAKRKQNIENISDHNSSNNNNNNNKNSDFDKNFNSNLSDDSKKLLDLSQIREHNVSFSAFGEMLNLTLKPTDGLFKNGPHALRMWIAQPEPNATQGVVYDEVEQIDEDKASEDIGHVFQDEKNMAAILMRRQLETGDLIMEGSIGHDMVIRPLPQKYSPHPDNVHHVVYRRQADATDQLSDFAFMEPDRLQRHYRERKSTKSRFAADLSTSASSWSTSSHSSSPVVDELDPVAAVESDNDEEEIIEKRTKRAVPHIIYPEILVIVDYDGYRLHGGDNLQVKRYFVSFWNGVDLRYRLLKGPRIRISIAGIIISRGRDATPYLERNRVGRDAIDSAAALTDMGKYLFRERRLPVYDIAVAITKYDMCRRRKGGRCTKGTAGFAYVGGACVVNKRLEKVNSVAIIEDTGGFSGIIVAAHEVGHLLGAVHDGSPPPSYLGGPGAEKCRWEDGYIMSDLRHTDRGFRWSACTIQSFHHFLNGDTASCLHNAPHEDSALGRALPGTLLSLDAQCRRDRGTYACFKDDRVCAQLFCFDSATGYCVAYRPAAEGSSCGTGVHCIDGRCVTHHENVIPDYSQHSANFANPNLYNPIYNEYDDYDETTTPSTTSSTSTTPSTTTSSTTTTTTTTSTTKRTTPLPRSKPTPSKYRSVKSYNNPTTTSRADNPSLKKSVSHYTTTSKKPSPNINPFYYGFSKLSTKPPLHSSIITSTKAIPTTTIPTIKTTTIKPLNTHTTHSKSNNNNNHYNSKYSYSNNNNNNNNNNKNNYSNSPNNSRLNYNNNNQHSTSTSKPYSLTTTIKSTTVQKPLSKYSTTTATTTTSTTKRPTTKPTVYKSVLGNTTVRLNTKPTPATTIATTTTIRTTPKKLSTTVTTKRPTTWTTQNGGRSWNSGNTTPTTKTNKTTTTTTTTTTTKKIPTTTTTPIPLFTKTQSSRNEFFETYHRKLATTTRSPYNFYNFGEYFKSSAGAPTAPPSYSANYLGDNSENSQIKLPVSVARRQTH